MLLAHCDAHVSTHHLDVERFDSIGLGFLLHCLPGDLAYKAHALAHLAAVLNPAGPLFAMWYRLLVGHGPLDPSFASTLVRLAARSMT